MVRVADSKLREIHRTQGGRIIEITIPKSLADDPQFPFRVGDELVLRIKRYGTTVGLWIEKNGE